MCIFSGLLCVWLSVPVQLIAWTASSQNELICVECDAELHLLAVTEQKKIQLILMHVQISIENMKPSFSDSLDYSFP